MSYMDTWQSDPVISAGRAKLGKLPENFRIYCAGWLGDISSNACVMKLEGAEFRTAKSGPRKGQLVIEVPGTKREAYLSSDEVKQACKKREPAIAYKE